MTDVYDERAKEAEFAGPAAREAAAQIARMVPIEGVSDPAYIAHLIQSELDRFETDPNAAIIESRAQGDDPVTGRTWGELLEDTKITPPGDPDPYIVKAARASAIRIARAYATKVRPQLSEFLEWTPGVIVEQFTKQVDDPADAYAAEVQVALGEIQAHRQTLGMPPLDVRGAGWSNLDVLDEAKRIRRLPNPLEDLKHRLI